MLKQLNLGFAEYTALIGASFLARVFANDFFVRLAHTKGVRSLLIFGTFGIMPLPMLWVFSSSFSYLMVLQIISGLVWGSHELGVVLVLLEEHSEKERSLVLTLTNLCNYLGMFFGGIIGAKILNKSSLNANDYYDIFWISTLARCVPIIVLLGIAQKNFKVKARSIYNRILSARVGGGSVTRPILYAQDEEESEKVRKS
jgi:MFS family permease